MKRLSLFFFIFVFSTFILSAQDEFYDILPNLDNCQEGKLKEVEKQKILAKINTIRKIHGLKPVTYNYTKDINVQKSALITAANEMLAHQPPPDSKCYSNEGAEGSLHSNLHIKWYYGNAYPSSEESINSWMLDFNVDVCGHRRWILDPFLKFIAFGRVDGHSTQNPQFGVMASSLYVIDNDKQNLADWDGDFIAYPFHNYPSELVFDSQNEYWHFHFTAVFDKNNWQANNKVDFSNAIIEIKDENGNPVSFNNVAANNEGYGVPNMLRFKMIGLQKDKRYTVTIRNVRYEAQSKNYTYWFRVSDDVGTPPAAPVLATPVNGATDLPTELTLEWNPVSDAATYNLNVSKDASFSQLLISETGLTGTEYRVKDLEENTTYYWRVSGTNNFGTGDWSEVFSFMTGKSSSIEPPILTYPADGATSVPTKFTVKWQKVNGAESYHLQISDSEQFPSLGLPIDQQNIPTNSYTVNSSLIKENTQYWYRVRAFANGNFSDWSDVYSFWTWLMSDVGEITNDHLDIRITPNPSSGVIKIISDKNTEYDIKIFNINGEIVADLVNIKSNHMIDVSKLSEGTYLIIISEQNSQYVTKFTIIK